MKHLKLIAVLTIASMILSACGQKGPLYLPESNKTVDADTKQRAKE